MTANPKQTPLATAHLRFHALLEAADRTLTDRTASLDTLRQLGEAGEQARVLAQQARLGVSFQNRAAEVKLRAERRAGALLAAVPLSKGGRPRKSGGQQTATRLSDLGIDKSRSSRWQLLARIPEADFCAFVESINADGNELTQRAALQVARRYGRPNSRGQAVDSPRRPAPAQDDGPSYSLVDELQNHCRQLIGILTPIREPDDMHAAANLHLAAPQRRYVARLLGEMEELLVGIDRPPSPSGCQS